MRNSSKESYKSITASEDADTGAAYSEQVDSRAAESRDNTVFDSVFKTLIHKAPQLVVPFVNEVFGRNYLPETPVIQFSNEHEGPRRSTVSDSVFRIGSKIYHIECQSTPEADMVVRMIEYDFAIALEGALSAGAPYEMDFPESCVLFLRHSQNTPNELEMKVNLPSGESFRYIAKVVKAQQYSSDDLFEKRLLILLPYYIMRYEDELENLAEDDQHVSSLIADCANLRANLEELTLQTGETLLYEQLVELIIRISDYMLRANEPVRRKVRRAMGGEVLELMRERAERLEREAEKRGIELGIEKGIEQGIEQGFEQGIERGIERGIEQGIEQGKFAILVELVHDGTLTSREASTRLGISEDQFTKLAKSAQ